MTTQAETDPTLLLVSGSKNRGNRDSEAAGIKKLAYALIETINKHGEANLKCVGAAAVNKAIKSITIAGLDEKVTEEHGQLVCSPGFGIAKFNNGEVEKTAIIIKVSPVGSFAPTA